MAMALCFNCNIAQRANRHFFDILDMSPEIVSILEVWTGREVSNADKLCQECFDLVLAELNHEQHPSEQQLGHNSICVCCGISLSPRTGRISRSLPEGNAERAYVADIIFPREIPQNARICNACWQRAHYRALQATVDNVHEPATQHIVEPEPVQVQDPVPEDEDMPRPQRRVLQINLQTYSRTPDSPNHCFVPECTNEQRLRVPAYLRKRILINNKVFVTSNSRVCQQHIGQYNWDLLDEHLFMNEFTAFHIEEMLLLLSETNNEAFSFENIKNLNEGLCHYWTGLTILNFLALFNTIQNGFGNLKKKKTALGLYLVNIRTGEPFSRIGSIFQITTSVVRSYTMKARNCLVSFYLPLHLGTGHISREEFRSRNLLIPQGLFGTATNSLIAIFDGTYIYLQKSSNYLFQKKTYSLHKYRNLVKPFLIVSTDGHILDVYGPYPATMSDATIMNKLFENSDSDLRNFFQANDVFILDRGFRDSIPLLQSLGLSIYKPETLSPNEGPQLSTIKANKSRLVTLCRWVIEVVNGRFKRDYKIFRNNYFNRMSKHLMNDFKIAAAIINNFHPVITDRADAELILQRALHRLNLPNYLAEHVLLLNLNRRRAHFVRIDAQLPTLDMFPQMEMSDLILFALGTYQIKQARSYYGEHIRPDGTFLVEVSNDYTIAIVPGISLSSHETVLIRGRIKSRHHSNTMYYTYILLNLSENNWQERICGYYCSCIIGKRTVGSCAHVMTIVWYLGWARHQETISAPATFLDGILVREDE